MSRPTTDIDPRLAKALAHPLRVRILSILEQRTATPKELALELRVPLGNVSYHVRALRDHGFLELERTRVVRGALEHRYRLTARPRISAETWAELPAMVREAFDAAAVGQVFEEVSGALAADGFADPASHIARYAFHLDDEGFAEASRVMTEALERFAEIETRAKARLGDERGRPALAVAMLFETSEAPVGAPAAVPADAHGHKANGHGVVIG